MPIKIPYEAYVWKKYLKGYLPKYEQWLSTSSEL